MTDIFYGAERDLSFGRNLRLNVRSTAAIRKLAAEAVAPFTLLLLDGRVRNIPPESLRRMEAVMEQTGAPLLYCDYYSGGEICRHALYQAGSVRDDFDFGHLLLFSTPALKAAAAAMTADYTGAGLYDLRLRLSESGRLPFYLREPLYEISDDNADDGESQFAYVDPRNESIQLEMQLAFTAWLKRTGAWLPAPSCRVEAEGEFPVEASVVIPVRNRAATIADAISSALSQECDSPFNVIVVDNHSDDGTTEAINAIADPRLVHIIPSSHTLGIGGCWNLAIASEHCGRYAVQLDSDDVYSSVHTLQRIVDKFRSEGCGLVVGSYMLTDFSLNELPPGLIAHREWTRENGLNNALRVNGFGAPRAYVTALARRFPMPNVSYGEDYAICLRLSRSYPVGRIYEPLYYCRRWSGNSDASLSREKLNRFNEYKDMVRSIELEARKFDVEAFFSRQFAVWPEVEENYRRLDVAETRPLGDYRLQCNPARARSTMAALDDASLKARRCFLCCDNRPEQQISHAIGDYEILVNPYPIFSRHLTIAHRRHCEQSITGRVAEMIGLATKLPGYTLFFNGARCGASAPDHQHFQAVQSAVLPIWKSALADGINNFGKMGYYYYTGTDAAAMAEMAAERWPDVNLLASFENGVERVIVIPRRAHRPECYAQGRLLVSPASVDLGGVIILPRPEDFKGITADDLDEIISEVCYTPQELQPMVKVGIVTADKASDIEICRNSYNTSTIRNVVIGKQFHWQRFEDQTFAGRFTMMRGSDGRVTAVNELPVEDYLQSVISSEMSATSSLDFLCAHAVISRSWLLAQMSHKQRNYAGECSESDEETVRWYDHESHVGFDVCADDHCQRYQGISRITTPRVAEALWITRGEVLIDGGEICDARFSKCCGGATELFSTCWQPVNPPYLKAFRDNAGSSPAPDLSDEATARQWIEGSPEAFCNTDSKEVLAEVLNSYDRETADFYRWRVEYSAEELAEIIRSRSGIDYGTILALNPLHRGASGRIDRLEIVGSRRRRIIGKELEIRRTLSPTHLYSSAFVVDSEGVDASGAPQRWILKGAGWGHGVGLCQIGAAVMAAEGYSYREILNHYFPGAHLARLY